MSSEINNIKKYRLKEKHSIKDIKNKDKQLDKDYLYSKENIVNKDGIWKNIVNKDGIWNVSHNENKNGYLNKINNLFNNKIFKKILISTGLLMMIGNAQALIIRTDKNIKIDKTKKTGRLSGQIIINKKAVENVVAKGSWNIISKNQISFVINKIETNDDIYTLKKRATTIYIYRGQSSLKKKTRIILAGEDEEELAGILKISTEDYIKNSGVISHTPSVVKKNKPVKEDSKSGGNGNSQSADIRPTKEYTGKSKAEEAYIASIEKGTGVTQNNENTSYKVPSFSAPVNTNNSLPIETKEKPKEKSAEEKEHERRLEEKRAEAEARAEERKYSSQFCKAPAREGDNMVLSIVDRDGSCLEINAYRDDTKCQYRHDFTEGYAIKQTQYYYVDKQNTLQNIGECVDLASDRYKFPFYRDDTKCTLQTTNNKEYKGGRAQMFQTQILFRGDDGLIHVALGCSDYQNVEEKLLEYEKDDTAKVVRRIVDQFYIDPITKERIILNSGIKSPFEFKYTEYTCGRWQMDDANLRAYRKTQIKAYDDIAAQYVDLTGCDYSSDKGKTGKITVAYNVLNSDYSDGESEAGDVNRSQSFTLIRGHYAPRRVREGKTQVDCSFFCDGDDEYDRLFPSGHTTTRWSTELRTVNTGVQTGYQRPKQDDEEAATVFIKSSRIKTIARKVNIIENQNTLSEFFLKFVEAREGFYRDEEYLNSKAYKDGVKNHYRPGNGMCKDWRIDPKEVRFSTGVEWRQTRYIVPVCINYLNYTW